jgi:hypothetical protein
MAQARWGMPRLAVSGLAASGSYRRIQQLSPRYLPPIKPEGRRTLFIIDRDVDHPD